MNDKKLSEEIRDIPLDEANKHLYSWGKKAYNLEQQSKQLQKENRILKTGSYLNEGKENGFKQQIKELKEDIEELKNAVTFYRNDRNFLKNIK